MPNKSELDTSHFSKNLDFVALADRMQLFGTGEPLMSAAFWEILESIDTESQTEVSINSTARCLPPSGSNGSFAHRSRQSASRSTPPEPTPTVGSAAATSIW